MNIQLQTESGGELIELIPRIDLHTGYHGTLLNDPPSGFRFSVANSEHIFIMNGDDWSPYESPHLGEFLQTASQHKITHTARWPVLGSSSWVADTDDLMYPIMCGRVSYDPRFQSMLRSDNADFRQTLKRRSLNMIAAYLHASCKSILVSGQPRISVEIAREWFENLGIASEGEDLLAKILIVRPSQKAATSESVEKKWAKDETLRILFCGRDFEIKNGFLTLQLMARLRKEFPSIECVYIGPIPADIISTSPELLQGLIHHNDLNHDSTLEAMRDAHVLLHPSKFDSIGIVMLEAMAAGMAVIAAQGHGMDYVNDFFGSGGALLIDRDVISADDEAPAFEAALQSLAMHPEIAREMGFRNYGLVSDGEYSIARQNEVLSGIYRSARQSPSSPLKLSDLPFVDGFKVIRMSSREVKDEERRFRRAGNLTRTGHLAVTV